MDFNLISPFIRRTMYSTLVEGFELSKRIIYDYEIIFIKSGSCTLFVEDKCFVCKDNNVVFIRPGISHSIICNKGCDLVQPHIHFDLTYDDKSIIRPICYKDIDEMSCEELNLICDDYLKNENIPYIFTPINISEFQTLFFSVIDDFINNKSLLVCKSNLMLLLNNIFNQFGVLKYKTSDSYNSVYSIKEYIDNNYMNKITLDLLANQFYLNKFTMLRNFKKAFGKNIISYCNDKKVNKAREFLEDTNLSVKTIGELLGYTDAYSFSRFFKSVTGISPKEYQIVSRKEKRGKNGMENNSFNY